MKAVSADFLAALRTSHAYETQVQGFLPDGSPPFDIPITDGTVTLDRTADRRARCDLTLAGPLQYPLLDTDPLAPYGVEVEVKRGVQFPDGSTELVSFGRMRVQDLDRSRPAGSATLTAYDRSAQVADERFTVPRKLSAANVTAQIQALIADVYPLATFNVGPDATSGAVVTFDRDRWAAIQQLAVAIGYEVYIDSELVWQIVPVPDATGDPAVWTVDTGPQGVLVSSDSSVTREGVANGVVAAGEPTSNRAPAFGLVTDDNPESPTLWGGPFGRVPRFYSSPLILTNGQAVTAAAAILRDQLGAFRSVSFQSVPNPALEPGDVLLVQDGDDPPVRYIFDSFTIGLSAGASMTGTSRAQSAVTE